jgi:hypothetical protein
MKRPVASATEISIVPNALSTPGTTSWLRSAERLLKPRPRQSSTISGKCSGVSPERSRLMRHLSTGWFVCYCLGLVSIRFTPVATVATSASYWWWYASKTGGID